MAEACEPGRLGPDSARTIQNFQWMAAPLCREKRIQNSGLALDRLIPIVEDQVKVICERFVEAQDSLDHEVGLQRSPMINLLFDMSFTWLIARTSPQVS